MRNRIVDMHPADKTSSNKCSRHPFKEATEQCVRCGTKLCFDCRLKEKKQAFCSSRCHRLHLIKEFKLSAVNLSPQLNRLKNHAPALDAFAMMMILMLIASIHFTPSDNHNKNTVAELPVEQIVVKTPEPKIILQKKAEIPIVSAEQQKTIVHEKTLYENQKKLNQKKSVNSKTIKSNSISKVITAEKKISITFDGGSNDSSAREILDILKSRKIHTTFFLTARFIKSYPDIVKRMVAEGHEVGNHTNRHPHLTTYDINKRHRTLPGIDSAFIKKELETTSEIFTKVTGEKMAPYWRAPYGEINKDILRWAAQAGYRHISWTVDRSTMESMDSLDWVADQSSRLYLSSEEIKDRLLAFADGEERASGGIVLMHLGTERKVDMVHNKLEDIIDSFLAKGYEVVPVSALLKVVKKG